MNSLIRSSLFNCEKAVRYLKRQDDVWEGMENQRDFRPSGALSLQCFWGSWVAEWQQLNSRVISVRDSHSVRSREVEWLTWSYSATWQYTWTYSPSTNILVLIVPQRQGPGSRTRQAPLSCKGGSYYLMLTFFVRCYKDLLSVQGNAF